MDTQIWIMLGGIFAGFFALIKYLLNHLERKNGHMERIADKFDGTVNRMTDVIEKGLHNINTDQKNIMQQMVGSKKKRK